MNSRQHPSHKTARVPRRLGTFVLLLGLPLLWQSWQTVQAGKVANGMNESERAAVEVRVAQGQETPFLKLHAVTGLPVVGGAAETGHSLAPVDRAQPLSLATADFDEDGVPDLVSGYADGTGGLVMVRLGNADAVYPNSPEALERRLSGHFTGAPFMAEAKSIALPEAASFVGTGDFDADGHWDIIAARKGGDKLYWLRGNGNGNLAAPQPTELHGVATALVTGEMNRADGLTDVVVGVVSAGGARVLIFESPMGAMRGAPESFALPAAASSMVLGQLDNEYAADLAIAADKEVLIMHGRDRKLSVDEGSRGTVAQASISTISLPFPVASIAAGDFADDRRAELALLSVDGAIRVLERVEQQVEQQKTKRRAVHDAIWQLSAMQELIVGSGTKAGQQELTASTSNSVPSLMRVKVSSLPKDELLVFGGGMNEMHVVTTRSAAVFNRSGEEPQGTGASLSVAASLVGDAEVTAVLPMRLNADALNDLVLTSKVGTTVVVTRAAATFVVTKTAITNDSSPGDGACKDSNNECSFVAALQESNALPGAETINFNIPGSGTPVIFGAGQGGFTGPVTIDATTQPGGRVEIDGQESLNQIGVSIRGGNSTVRGFAIYGHTSGIVVAGDNNIVENNIVGLKSDGITPGGEVNFALDIQGGTNNLIGGTTAQARNVFSNSRSEAVFVRGGGVNNRFQGNYIGTNSSGTATVNNNNPGIRFFDSSDFQLGGATAGAGNLLSGNGAGGTHIPTISIEKGPGLVQGNLIGTDASGSQPLGNGGPGIAVADGGGTVVIGGTTPAAKNVISASLGSHGIQLNTGCCGHTDLIVQGNFIGTNKAGTGALPNAGHGILATGRPTTIGGAVPGAGNLISGNGGDGINVAGFAVDTVIQSNYIGTGFGGTYTVPNAGNGVNLLTGKALIGGSTQAARNIITGNLQNGIRVASADGTTPHRIEGNQIGNYDFGNRGHGILLEFINVENVAQISRNVIARNGGDGISSNDNLLRASVLSNSIIFNGGLGIDRANDGVSPNAPHTPSGNNPSDHPVITSVQLSDIEITINGKLRNFANRSYTLQFFSSQSCDVSGYGEGERYIGQTTVTTDANGDAAFSATFTPEANISRSYFTATTVGANPHGNMNTSEFSFCHSFFPTYSSGHAVEGSFRSISPKRGSATGITDVTVFGAGILQGTGLSLVRPVLSTEEGALSEQRITCTVTRISSDGTVLEAECDPSRITGPEAGPIHGSKWFVASPGGVSYIDEALTFNFDPEIKDDFYTDVIGPGVVRRSSNPLRYGIVVGNRGNTRQPPSLVRVTLPRGLKFHSLQPPAFDEADPSRRGAGVLPYVEEYKPESLGGTGETVLSFFVPANRAGAARTYALQLLATDETTLGQELTVAATSNSSTAYNSIINVPVDPAITIEPTSVESTADRLKVQLEVNSPNGGSGPVEVEFSCSPADFEALPEVSIADDGSGKLTYIYKATLDDGTLRICEGKVRARKSTLDVVEKYEFFREHMRMLRHERKAAEAAQQRGADIDISSLGLNIHNLALLDLFIYRGMLQPDPQYAAILDQWRKDLEALGRIHHAQPRLRVIQAIKEKPPVYEAVVGVSIDLEIPFHHLNQRIDYAVVLDEDQSTLAKLRRAIRKLKVVAAYDPNDKSGALGTGTQQRFISGREDLRYLIQFENVATATAPAQEVVITDQLDTTKLDLDTFQLGTVSFGNGFAVTPPSGLSHWTTDIDMRPTRNVTARVIAALDKNNGIVTWRFFSLDPATGQPTADPLDGFLPPNKKPSEGDGAVMFTVRPKPDQPAGTEIRNGARIVFDENAPIDTPEWLNTIDDSRPESQVAALASTQDTVNFNVNWSGADTGAGVSYYTIYVSVNGGPFQIWLDNTSAASGVFTGRPGGIYAFYSVATDGADNREEPPATADATTAVSSSAPTPTTLEFGAASFNVNEADARVTLSVTRSGDTTGSSSVGYATVDNTAAVRCDDNATLPGTAFARCDYATSLDTLTFSPGETTKSFTVPIINDAHVESSETVTLRLFNPTSATLGERATAIVTILDNDAAGQPNPAQAVSFFVRQHYLDFLSREPEPGEPWTGVLNRCPDMFNTDPRSVSAACDFITVSQSFFGSPEFRLKGFYVFTHYRVAFGRVAEYAEIVADMRSVTGQTPSDTFTRRAEFPTSFTQRAEFRSRFDSLSDAAYVDALLDRYGVQQISTPDPASPEGGTKVTLARADLVARLGTRQLTRAQVLRAVVESDQITAQEFTNAFVAMQYYGYLRRTPEPAGYQNWLNFLRANPTDSRTMVNGFLNSIEYRLRFGPLH